MSAHEKVDAPDLGAIRRRLETYRRRHYLGRDEWKDLVAHAPADLAALLDRVAELEAERGEQPHE